MRPVTRTHEFRPCRLRVRGLSDAIETAIHRLQASLRAEIEKVTDPGLGASGYGQPEGKWWVVLGSNQRPIG